MFLIIGLIVDFFFKKKAKSNKEIVLDIQSKSSEAEKPQSVDYLSLHHLTTAKPQHDQNVTTQQFSMERNRWF